MRLFRRLTIRASSGPKCSWWKNLDVQASRQTVLHLIGNGTGTGNLYANMMCRDLWTNLNHNSREKARKTPDYTLSFWTHFMIENWQKWTILFWGGEAKRICFTTSINLNSILCVYKTLAKSPSLIHCSSGHWFVSSCLAICSNNIFLELKIGLWINYTWFCSPYARYF